MLLKHITVIILFQLMLLDDIKVTHLTNLLKKLFYEINAFKIFVAFV